METGEITYKTNTSKKNSMLSVLPVGVVVERT